VNNFDKYLRDHKLSEEIDMSKNIMNANEYLSLLESDEVDMATPEPKDTILTKLSSYKSDGTGVSLASMSGDDKSSTPREEVKKKEKNATALADLGGADKDFDIKGTKNADITDISFETIAEDASLTFEDADFDTMSDETETMDDMDNMDNMDDMGTDGISMTKEFMADLLTAVSTAELDVDAVATIVDCVAECAEAGTLDVADIADVMAKMKAKVEDVAAGDGEFAGDEGGDEFEGEMQLMGDMSDMEDEDEDLDEGKDDDDKMANLRAKKKGGNKASDEDEDEDEDEDKDDLKEAWLSTIPNVGNPREVADTTGMSDEDVEFAEMRRLSGMK
jgi:hypothetical protein